MRRFMILIAFLCMCYITHTESNVKEPAQRTIFLTVGAGPFAFGEPVLLRVSYINQGDDSWEIKNPTNSLSTVVRYKLVGSEERLQGYGLVREKITTRKRPDGTVISARVVPIPQSISIAPGESYKFETPFERDWTGDVIPGLWNVWFEDEDLELISNTLEIPLIFTRTSIKICLQKAADDKLSPFKRTFHSKWVNEVIPDFDLQWPSNDMSEQERKMLEISNKKTIQAAEKFLSEKSNARVIEAAMQKINKGIEEIQGMPLDF